MWPETVPAPRLGEPSQISETLRAFEKAYESRVDPDELSDREDPIEDVHENRELFDENAIRAFIVGAKHLRRRRKGMQGLALLEEAPNRIFSPYLMDLTRNNILAQYAERDN